MKYGNRIIKIQFARDERNQSEWAALCTSLYAEFHGRRNKIILGNDPGFYYLGRISVQVVKSSLITSLINITATCDPWKYKASPTTAYTSASAGGTLKVFSNLFAPARPTFTTSAAGIEVKHGTRRFSIPPGSVQVPEIVFPAGNTSLTFYGSGDITVTWKEGTL